MGSENITGTKLEKYLHSLENNSWHLTILTIYTGWGGNCLTGYKVRMHKLCAEKEERDWPPSIHSHLPPTTVIPR